MRCRTLHRPRSCASICAALSASLLVSSPTSALAKEEPPAEVAPCPSGQASPDVAALVKRFEQVTKGRSSHAKVTMAIKTKSYGRALKLEIWSRGQDFALVRVLGGGPRETGMMTLKREKQLWNWLPQAGRVMKLPSGMMGDSWMGSDFTNDDLVRGTSLVDDFDATIAPGAEKKDGHDVWHVILKPKANAAVVWGRIDLLVDRATCVPLSQVFFDEEGKQAREMIFSDVRRVGWRDLPMKMTVHPAEEGRETSLTYEEIELDLPIAEETFSLQRLRQGK